MTPIIRVELSGNLCRCTGYLGIINAVESVIAARASKPTAVASAAAAPPPAPLQAFAPTRKVAPASMTTPAPAQSVSDLDAVEHSMAAAAVTRALMQVFAS